jgi:hypothetical protein
METEYGVPTASVHTDIFEPLARAQAHAKGMPKQRFVFVPQPVMGKSPEELRAYVDGKDPLTGRPFMTEVLEALTRPLGDDETQLVNFDRTTPRLCEADTDAHLNELFLRENWTDKLPIVLPTEARVKAMLEGTSHHPAEVVGRMRPTGPREAWGYTVEMVAVNAVMAGARPEYFPVILALAATQVTARASTTSSAAAMAVVNGPIREEIDMNWGVGAMGPHNHANATIGRAYGLLSQNGQGGSLPLHTYLGSQGNNYAYNSICYAENEDRSPWEPFHVQHGFEKTDSTVSVFGGCRSTAFTLGLRQKHWKTHVVNLLRGMDPHHSPTFVLDPITARQFIDRGGFDTVDKLIDWVHEVGTMQAGIYWDYQLIENYVEPRALVGEEPYATMLEAKEDEYIRIWTKDKIKVVVVGGETNGYWRIFGANYAGTVSVDDWR